MYEKLDIIRKETNLPVRVICQPDFHPLSGRKVLYVYCKGKVSMRAMKRCIDRGFDVDLHSGCYMESDAFSLCMASPDGKEGMTAFLEKRKPKFEGDLG